MASDQEALLLRIEYDLNRLAKQNDAAVGIVNAGAGKMSASAARAAAEVEKSYGAISVEGFRTALVDTAKLQDRLTAAQLAGNRQEARALAEQLTLQKAVNAASVLQLQTQLRNRDTSR